MKELDSTLSITIAIGRNNKGKNTMNIDPNRAATDEECEQDNEAQLAYHILCSKHHIRNGGSDSFDPPERSDRQWSILCTWTDITLFQEPNGWCANNGPTYPTALQAYEAAQSIPVI